MPFFRAHLRDVQSVEYRYQVQRDLEQPPLAEAVADFTLRMREMRGHLALSHKLPARYQQERWYLEAAHAYCQAVTALRDYCVNIKGTRVSVSRYEDEADYGEEIRRTFAKFARDAAKDGLEFCYPAVSAGSKRERICVVTGPNHGGKTTFARMFGQLHYLASLGLPVPAARAELFLPDRVFTHFEREEDLATLRGKFEDELVRIRAVLEEATGDSVLVMNETDLSADLELGVMLRAMAGEDKFLYSTARQGLHSGLTIPEEIVYRQQVLADCIDHPDVVRELCDLVVETITAENRAIGFSLRDSPESIGYRARQQLELDAKMFRRLREISDVHAAEFRSEGFTRFFAMLCAELDDAYLAEVEAQISELEFRHGTLMSARLGSGNKGAGYVLWRHPEQGWREWMSGLSQRLDPTGCPSLSACDLYDASPALSLRDQAVGNDVDADGKQLIMVTGANQGGKSTFLRSVGLAQLMTQAGMSVAARSYAASVSTGIFTHFKRGEDAAMEMGKLDEELDRMSRITDQLRPGCLLLCNESFASTNEREGSEIARQVIRALTEARIRVIFVTHLYDLAERWYARHDLAALFLRAERQPDGRRTFRVPPGEPLPTSYGQDLYQQVFGTAGM